MRSARLPVASTRFAWLAALALTACSSPEPDEPSSVDKAARGAEATSAAPALDFTDAAGQIQTLAIQMGNELISRCDELGRRVQAFLSAPDEPGRDAARDAYHPCYEQWRRYRLFQQVPFSIKDREIFEQTVKLIDTRPFQPGYIDGLPEYPYSGLVFETGLTLSLNNLLDQHRMMDEESAALGFPVIETLLWREPLPALWLEQPPAGTTDDASVVSRRRQYLALASDDLMIRLKASTQRWRPGQDYANLPRPTQRRLFWQSAHRLVQVDMLQAGFSSEALADPEWHHPSMLAGLGRRHWLAMLDGLSLLFAANPDEQPAPLATWMQASEREPTAASLARSVDEARAAVRALPANYPAGSTADDTWQRARRSLQQLADDLNQALRQQGFSPG